MKDSKAKAKNVEAEINAALGSRLDQVKSGGNEFADFEKKKDEGCDLGEEKVEAPTAKAVETGAFDLQAEGEEGCDTGGEKN